MTIDYISLYWTAIFVLATPFIQVNKYLNPWLWFGWIYASIHGHFNYTYIPITIPQQVVFDSHQRGFMILILIFFLTMKSKVDAKKILKIIGVVAITLSILCLPFNFDITYILDKIPNFKDSNLYKGWFSANAMWLSGLVPNKAMNAILLVVLLPYLMEVKKWTIFPVTIVVLLSKSSSAYLSLCVFLLGLLNYDLKIRLKTKIAISLSSGIIAGFICYKFVPNFLNGGDRFYMYQVMFKHHYFMVKDGGYQLITGSWNIWNYLFGMGPVSYPAIIPKIQKLISHVNEGYYIFAHSDILQYIFEFGALSLVLLGWAFYGIFKCAKRNEVLALCGLFAGSVFYYPFHFPVHVGVTFLILKLVFKNA